MVPGKKAQLLARLYGRPREDDPRDLLVEIGGEGHSHGQVSLAGSGRTDAYDYVVASYGLDVELLVGRLRGDDLAARRDIYLVLVKLVHALVRVGDIADGVVYVGWIDGKALLDDACQLVDHLARVLHLFLLADQGEVVPPYACPHVKVFLEVLYVFFSWAEQVAGEVVVIKGELYYLFFCFVFQ